jgi:hypothetical protein
MRFITNHDENAWAGTTIERMGDKRFAFAALVHTITGMPLIYNGQEADLNLRLSFFDKSEVPWQGLPRYDFYRKFLFLKKNNPALWNGEYGANMVKLADDDMVYAFKRQKGDDIVAGIFNFSDDPRTITFAGDIINLYDIFSSLPLTKRVGHSLTVPGNSFNVYASQPIDYSKE